MGTLSEMWAVEQAKLGINRVEEERLDRGVDDLMRCSDISWPLPEKWARDNALHILSRSDAQVERGEPYTRDQAVEALYWHIGEVISYIAEEHILDSGELRDGVWRKMSLDKARSRARRIDFLSDILRVLKEERS